MSFTLSSSVRTCPFRSRVGAVRDISAFSSPLVRVLTTRFDGAEGVEAPAAAPTVKLLTDMEYVSAELQP